MSVGGRSRDKGGAEGNSNWSLLCICVVCTFVNRLFTSISYRGCCESDSGGTPKLLVRERSRGVCGGRGKGAWCTHLPTLWVSCLGSLCGKRSRKWDRGVEGTTGHPQKGKLSWSTQVVTEAVLL